MIYNLYSQHHIKRKEYSWPCYLQVSHLWIQLKVDGKQYFGSWLGLRFGICGYEGTYSLFYAILYQRPERPRILVSAGDPGPKYLMIFEG